MASHAQLMPQTPGVLGGISFTDLSTLLVQAQRSLHADPDAAEAMLGRAAAMLLGAAPERRPASPTGALADWQVKRVKAHVEARLDSSIRLADLAALVRLTPSHFGRAFKASVGVTPHAYILERRIERARMLMLTTTTPLAQIAQDCGMADQSHLTRVFRRFVGSSPYAWRRRQQAEGSSAVITRH